MEEKLKARLANVVCVLVTLFIWGLFITPILVIAFALLNYFSPGLDFSANSTIADVFDSVACKNTTLEQAIISIREVAAGNYSRNFTCTSPYLSNGSQCVPECLRWHPGGDVYYYLFRFTVPVLSCVTTVVGLIGASTWLCLKRLWKFPHIISLYLLLTIIGQGLMIFIGSLSPKNFYCSDSNLLVSRVKSTIPCHVQGALFHFFILSFMLWYICDVFNILYVILRPLKADKFFLHRNKIHIIEAIISWGLPALLVILIGGIKGYEIVSAPVTCLPYVYITLLTFFVPGVVFSLLTQTSFAILGTVLYKRHIKLSTSTTNREYLDTLRQIALFSTSFSILTIIILVNYAFLAIGYRGVEEYTSDYWQCITVFGSDTGCCKPIYIDHYYPFTGFLSDSAFCIWGMVGAGAVSVKEAKNIWKRGFKRCFDTLHSTAGSGLTSKIVISESSKANNVQLEVYD